MDQAKTSLHKYAMQYGTAMGLFWAAKFTLFPLGLTMPLLEVLFLLMTLAVPVIAWAMTRHFRDRRCSGVLSYFQALAFSFLVYLYASLLVAVAHYVYFEYIDNGYLLRTYGTLIQRASEMEGMKEMAGQLLAMIEELRPLSAIRLTMQLLSQNLFYGVIVSFPVALLTMRRPAR